MATSRSVPCSVNAVDPDVVIVVRTTGGGRGRVANHTTAPASSGDRPAQRPSVPRRAATAVCVGSGADAVPVAATPA